MANEELASNLVRTIVEQRSQLAGEPRHSTDTFLESASQQAEHILSFGLDIAVHISITPSNCQCKANCKKTIEFEVWTIKLEKFNDEPTILTSFLQQAIKSQLYFSPFNAWLSENFNGKLPKNYKCIYRLSTKPKFTKQTKTQSHVFPCCFVDRNNRDALKISVEWMCKEEFGELGKCFKEKKLNTTIKDSTLKNENIINDCPIEENLSEKHALTTFTTSSSNNYPHLLLDKKKRIRRNTTGSELVNRGNYNGSPVPWSQSKSQKTPNRSPPNSGLLCNFEESALKGRLQPINSLDGFKLQLIIQDRFNSSPLEMPITTYYFNISDDNTPSLYLGHCSLNEDSSENKPIRISKNTTIQATIFNPQGSVVKIFIVPIKVKTQPNLKTFVRQRTYCMPKNLSINEVERSWLRYLIHFRLATDGQSRLFLHSEIKMLFANKVDVDMDVQNLVGGQEKYHLVTTTEDPSRVK